MSKEWQIPLSANHFNLVMVLAFVPFFYSLNTTDIFWLTVCFCFSFWHNGVFYNFLFSEYPRHLHCFLITLILFWWEKTTHQQVRWNYINSFIKSEEKEKKGEKLRNIIFFGKNENALEVVIILMLKVKRSNQIKNWF